MLTAIHKRYESVLYHERSWAEAVALAAMKPKPLTVWDVLIPVFIIFNHMRLKGAREVFAQNLLFTKELALDAALAMTRDGQGKESAMFPIKEKTQALLASVKDGIYSEAIRQRQLKEIDLLIHHYCRLLKADGEDYDALLSNSYRSQKDYEAFLERLKVAENEVNSAAVETLGSQADMQVLSRIEKASDRIRLAGSHRIFQPNNRERNARQ